MTSPTTAVAPPRAYSTMVPTTRQWITREATTAAAPASPVAAATTRGPVATDPTTDPRTDSPTEALVGESGAPPETGWVTLASPDVDVSSEPPLRMRRIISQLAVGVVLV